MNQLNLNVVKLSESAESETASYGGWLTSTFMKNSCLLFLVLMLLFSRCIEGDEVKKATVLDLQEFLKYNQEYDHFINAHISNMRSIYSLDETDDRKFKALIDEINLNKNILENTKALYDLIQFDIRTFNYFDGFTATLKSKFVFEESDLIEVMRITTRKRLLALKADSKCLEFPSYDEACGIYCSMRALKHEAASLYNGIDPILASIAKSSYYLGCVDGCLHPQ